LNEISPEKRMGVGMDGIPQLAYGKAWRPKSTVIPPQLWRIGFMNPHRYQKPWMLEFLT
jgi:hypothetical protein